MSSHVVPLDDIVVASGQTASNVLTARTHYRDADSITFFGPATLPETATLQSSDTEDGSSGWFNVSRGGVDVTIPAGKAVTLELPSFRAIRVLLSGAAGATRTFKVNKGFFA